MPCSGRPFKLLATALGCVEAAKLTSDLSMGQEIGIRFWETTGWCPPDPLNTADGSAGGFADFFVNESSKQMHIALASAPRQGVRFVRIHYLLALLKFSDEARSRFPDNFEPDTDFDFSGLDAGMDMLVDLDFRVVFELMGNPGQLDSGGGEGGLFTDFGKAEELRVWRDMVKAVASRYIKRYGLDVVSGWEWQGWNEPDHNCNSDRKMKAGIDCNPDSFVQWSFALEEGLKLASPKHRLTFGGPNTGGSTLDQKNGIIDAFLDAIVKSNGTHQLDFINWHQKGKNKGQHVTDADIDIINHIAEKYPSLSRIPVQNDEGDPEGGWSKKEDWRGDARYPSIVAKIVDEHLQQIVLHGSDALQNKAAVYRRNSNDNAFLNYGSPEHVFTQRTLVSRFMMNETGTIEVLRKPVLNVMALLTRLGPTHHATTPAGLAVADEDELGALITSTPAGKQQGEISVLLYRNHDTLACKSAGAAPVSVELAGVDLAEAALPAMAMTYLIDDAAARNPMVNWTALGAPTYPSAEAFAQLRESAELQALAPPAAVSPGALRLDLALPCPGVLLHHVCAPVGAAAVAPAVVPAPRLHVTPTRAPAEVLVYWKGLDAPCLRTYEVHYAARSGGPFARANRLDTIFSSFVHAQPGSTVGSGCYKVRAVDYWDRRGPLSDEVCVASGDGSVAV